MRIGVDVAGPPVPPPAAAAAVVAVMRHIISVTKSVADGGAVGAIGAEVRCGAVQQRDQFR